MDPPTPRTLTLLLNAWSAGDREAAAQAMASAYAELRRIAACYFRHERRDHTWQPTVLVHEVYLTLARTPVCRWRNRAHFFGLAARMMRRALVDHGRYRGRQKRWGGQRRSPLAAVDAEQPTRFEDITALDAALYDLGRRDARKARIVELRFFAGLSITEVARCLRIAPRTVDREWRVAKAWLRRSLGPWDGQAR